jgi:hypothetical protein
VSFISVNENTLSSYAAVLKLRNNHSLTSKITAPFQESELRAVDSSFRAVNSGFKAVDSAANISLGFGCK